MPHLKSRDNHPPGGFKFYQSQTNWKAPEWQSFSTVVQAVVSHRKGNPGIAEQYSLSTDPVAVEQEVDAYNAQVCKANGWTEYYAEDENPKPFPHHPYQETPGAGGVVGNVRKTAIGVATIKEWLGEGLKPVDRPLAESRASVCANCPHNVNDPNWFNTLKESAAEMIRDQIQAKNQMQLVTANDAKIEQCEVCGCYLRLKVWCPKEIVQNNTPADIREKLPSFCWIKQESASPP